MVVGLWVFVSIMALCGVDIGSWDWKDARVSIQFTVIDERSVFGF
jgi:hypothetical protein